MRSPDSFNAPTQMAANGAHLASTLYRLAHDRRDAHGHPAPEALWSEIAARVSELVDVRALRVVRDPTTETLTLELRQGPGPWLPARAVSDGTLRFLAMCILDADSSFEGLVCMEEPENGIHPARLRAMVDLVKDLAVDPYAAVDDDNPLRQVIINTHSPTVVELLQHDDILYAHLAAVQGDGGDVARVPVLRPLRGNWRCRNGSPEISRDEIRQRLESLPGQQLKLVFDAQT